jgi:predicted RNA-binding Zn ribbon-like protein
VQDLINTRATLRLGQDLLADRESAEEWLREAGGAWADSVGIDHPSPSLSRADLTAFRDLRAVLERMLFIRADEAPAYAAQRAVEQRATVRLISDNTGQIGMIPLGRGRGWLESAVWSEVLLAQRASNWSRLKLCRESNCRSAFYDTSRNNSGVWHNVRTCGNAANLRASRRRKSMEQA